MTDIRIRELRTGDRAGWQQLWTAYLDFYRARVSPEVYDTTWRRLHDPAEPMFAFGAEADGRLVGIVHFLYHRTCWSIGDYCYLQDLYVDDAVRGHGFGRALIEAVYERAKQDGASRVHWLTHETNATARKLYDTLAEAPGFIQYRKLF